MHVGTEKILEKNSLSIADAPKNSRTRHVLNITATTVCLVPVQIYHTMKAKKNKEIYSNYSIMTQRRFLICVRKLVFTNRPTADVVCEISASCEEIRVKTLTRHTQEVLVNFRSKKKNTRKIKNHSSTGSLVAMCRHIWPNLYWKLMLTLMQPHFNLISLGI